MNEYSMIALMSISGALFALGGTGFKWARRYVLPLFIVAFTALYGTFIQHSIYLIVLCLALHMGYGERTPYWKKFLILCGYSFPALVYGFTWWAFITPVILIVLFRLSNYKLTSEIVFWKFWEFLSGVLIAVTIIDAIN